MTTVEQIRTEIDNFKAGVVRAADNFAAQGHVSRDQVDTFLATAGIERPEAPEVTAAREELAALKAAVRSAVEQVVVDDYSRRTALSAMGL
jgi:hypothetical protein